MRPIKLLLAAVLLLFPGAGLAAANPDDWPQLLGPGRDGRYLGPAPDGLPDEPSGMMFEDSCDA